MKLPSLKTAAKTASWVPIVVAVVTVILKQLGYPVSEDFITQILSLFGIGGAGLVASNFIPAISTPEIHGMEKVAYDAWFVLDHELSDDEESRTALDKLDDRMKARYRSFRDSKKSPTVASARTETRLDTVMKALSAIEEGLKPKDAGPHSSTGGA